MVRISSDEQVDRVLLRVEGSLRGPWVAELERVWQLNRERGKSVYVSLEDIQYVDNAGKALLPECFRMGQRSRPAAC